MMKTIQKNEQKRRNIDWIAGYTIDTYIFLKKFQTLILQKKCPNLMAIRQSKRMIYLKLVKTKKLKHEFSNYSYMRERNIIPKA